MTIATSLWAWTLLGAAGTCRAPQTQGKSNPILPHCPPVCPGAQHTPVHGTQEFDLQYYGVLTVSLGRINNLGIPIPHCYYQY